MLQFLLTLTDESNHSIIEHLYHKYKDLMMRCAVTQFKSFGRTNFMYDAEDAVQNTFMKITRYIGRIDFSRKGTDVKNYCLAILNNEIRNILKENHENFEINEELLTGDEYNIVEELELYDRYEEIVSAIETLDFKYCTTLQLYFCEEMTPNEIADMMGISVKTVYTRLARGKKLLIESFKGAKSNG